VRLEDVQVYPELPVFIADEEVVGVGIIVSFAYLAFGWHCARSTKE